MKIQFLFLTVACFLLSGCSKNEVATTNDAATTITMDELPPELDAGGHPEHGPHGGELIELGQESFHIEMTHENESVAMYVLDTSATEPVAIDADKLTVSLKHDGQVKTFDLAADRQEGDADGKSSGFKSSDETLVQWMESGAEGAVSLQIDGKSFTGKISHHHDHDHDH
ncbi:MAG: hypothetical protein WBD20_21305 [Pirellulaceae bacterium]